MHRIPFLSLTSQHDLIRKDLEQGFRKVIDGERFVLGEEVALFEKEYAAYTGVNHCISVANGLDALAISLSAIGVGPGDEVIVPALTCAPTWMAVSKIGATPVPVDVERFSFNIDVDKIVGAVSARTKAVVPVNLYGRPANLPAIHSITSVQNVFMVEDNAQAQGASIGDRKTGSFGKINATSFYPTKNLGAMGDGGAITTDDHELAIKAGKLRNYGSSKRFVNEVVGVNSRLDELQACVLRIKLRHLDRWNEERKTLGGIYRDLLKGVGDIVMPVDADTHHSAIHLFVMCTAQREKLREHLQLLGIETDIHYPTPPHLQAAYAHLGYKKTSFPVAEQICSTIMSLPLWPGMRREDVVYVSEKIRRFFIGQ
jgi:dTDP-4-amino-4,6-dideoxygalactose transaminase